MRSNQSIVLESYIVETFVQEGELLEDVRLKGESLVPGMQVSPSEGQFLHVLVHMMSARNILEIGTFVGYSALSMASALPEDGQVTSIEASAKNAAIAKEFITRSSHGHKIRVVESKALEWLQSLDKKEHMFDMVFIDAAKSEYAQYLELIEPFVRPGGVIIGDNTLLFGNMIGEPKKEVSQQAIESMHRFNSRLGDATIYKSILLPTEEGLTIALKLP